MDRSLHNGGNQGKPKSNIPIIDFSCWTSSSASADERLIVARNLVLACHEKGFVYIINHGISSSLRQEAFAWSKKWYDLDMSDKMKAAQPEDSQSFRGYKWPGRENIANLDSSLSPEEQLQAQSATDYNESYGMGSDENTEDVNVWPPDDTLPGFRNFATSFYWECWKTAQNVLRALSLGLGSDDADLLLNFHTGYENELNLRHYPPVAASKLESREMRRLGVHSDFDSLTLLFQDDCGGLEVQVPGRPGIFVPIDPIENSLVMNIGDVLSRWSNDYLMSTKHRVHLPPLQDHYTGSERMTKERFSIPYFVLPKSDTVMECLDLPICSNEHNPIKYDPMSFGEYMRQQSELIS